MEARLVALDTLLNSEKMKENSTHELLGENNNVKMENQNEVKMESKSEVKTEEKESRAQLPGRFHINWAFMIAFGLAHVFGAVGLVYILMGKIKLSTIIIGLIIAEFGGYGITVGGHRLWAHRTFKARTPLKVLLAICFSLAGQHSIWRWVSWHRVHHKFVDTDADPHNSNRGFFFSHIGWLLTYDHDKFVPNLKKIDMSDLKKEPIIMWHKKYYMFLYVPIIFVMPTVIPWYFYGESLFNAFCVSACLRYVYLSHRTFLVNSAAHLYGSKPYDKFLMPRENRFVSFVALGEGWHNYHHVFPWDYKTSELGFYRWNLSTAMIDFFAWLGLAYDLKSVSKETVMSRVRRTGDGTHQHHHHHDTAWGWGDKDIPQENILLTETTYPSKKTL